MGTRILYASRGPEQRHQQRSVTVQLRELSSELTAPSAMHELHEWAEAYTRHTQPESQWMDMDMEIER